MSSGNNPLTVSDIVETVLLFVVVGFFVVEGGDLKRTFDAGTFFVAMFFVGFIITSLIFLIYYLTRGVMFNSNRRMIKTAFMYSLIVGTLFVIGSDKINRAYADDEIKDVDYTIVDKRIYRTRGKSRRTVYSFYIMRDGEKKEIEIGRDNWERYKSVLKITLPEHAGFFGVDFYDDILFRD